MRLQRRNLPHDLIGDPLIDFFEPRLGTVAGFGPKLGEPQRFSELDRHAVRSRKREMPPKRLVSPKNSNRHHGGAGFEDDQPDSGTSGLQAVVTCPSAFRKQDYAPAGEETIQYLPQPGSPTAFAVHGDRIPRAQNRADQRKTKERVARQIVDGARETCANQRRVEKARVI